MKTKHIIIILSCVAAIVSCSKKEIPVFESDLSGIYFQRISGSGGTEYYTDSTYVTFTLSSPDVTDKLEYAELRTMGKTVGYDRPVKVSVDREKTTATQGVHFEINTDTVRIPAGKASTPVYVRLLRTPDLLEETHSIVLKIEDNEHFTCYLDEYKSNSSYTLFGGKTSGVSFIITFSEQYVQPFYWMFAWWNLWDWSPQKYRLVNDLCNLTVEDWANGGSTGSPVQYGRLGYYARITRDYLQQMADAGTPVKDADGSNMQLGPDYLVDYSAYE